MLIHLYLWGWLGYIAVTNSSRTQHLKTTQVSFLFMLLTTRGSVLGHPHMGTQADKTASVRAFFIAVKRVKNTLGHTQGSRAQPSREASLPFTTHWTGQIMRPQPSHRGQEVESPRVPKSRVLEISAGIVNSSHSNALWLVIFTSVSQQIASSAGQWAVSYSLCNPKA